MTTTLSGLLENCVKYMLFPYSGDGNSNVISRDLLETSSLNYLALLSRYISSYIWQCDPFNLHVVEEKETRGLCLEGRTCFEDNIEDEWFIVFLLLHLTKEDQNLVIKVEDSDGEFLLIEAADYLPKWLDPETSKNRVFLYRGALHIIPIAQNPGQITPIPNGVPLIPDAVAAVRQFSSVTEAPTSVQKAVQGRIEGYPGKIRELQHKAHCYVPAGVAAVLKEDPSLLPHAVRAFYLRTPLDLKVCSAMMYFPPETRVMTEVLFTRCLYAQLVSQKYVPDRRIGWNLPPSNHSDFQAYDLGMKLACGFEILASNAPQLATEQGDLSNHDFSADVRWSRFLKSLCDKGYFKDEIEGSRLYNQLLQQAKNFYLQSLCGSSLPEKHYPSTRVRQLLETLNVNFEELKTAEYDLSPADDDSWLQITPDQLEAILTGRSGTGGLVKEEEVAQAVSGSLKSFLHHTSGFEGAEIPSSVSKKQKVALDPEAFSDAFRNILDFKVPDSDDEQSSSSMSSYSYEEDSEVELGESGASGIKRAGSQNCGILNDIKSYMEEMDRELATTDVGKSFERIPPPPKGLQKASEQNIHSLDESLDIDEELDEFCPVDVDMTALKNILESYTSQQGLPGPASNLLSSMSVHLPQNTDT